MPEERKFRVEVFFADERAARDFFAEVTHRDGDCQLYNLKGEAEDAVTNDAETFIRVVDVVTEELVDTALSSNIKRRHHLDSAVSAFEDVSIMLKAERIVRDLLLADEDGPPERDLTTD